VDLGRTLIGRVTTQQADHFDPAAQECQQRRVAGEQGQ